MIKKILGFGTERCLNAPIHHLKRCAIPAVDSFHQSLNTPIHVQRAPSCRHTGRGTAPLSALHRDRLRVTPRPLLLRRRPRHFRGLCPDSSSPAASAATSESSRLLQRRREIAPASTSTPRCYEAERAAEHHLHGVACAATKVRLGRGLPLQRPAEDSSAGPRRGRRRDQSHWAREFNHAQRLRPAMKPTALARPRPAHCSEQRKGQDPGAANLSQSRVAPQGSQRAARRR